MFRHWISSKALVAILLPVCLAAPGGTTICQPKTTYSGDAFGAGVNLLGLRTTVSDTGPLPSNGGSLSAQLANIDVANVLKVGLLTESTTGGANRTSSQASVANVALNAAGIGITASVLTSNATAQACGGGSSSVAGGSTIADLVVNGLQITVTGEPNQTIPLLVGALIINEQISSVTSTSCGGSANMRVNALHLTVAGLADVVIASSEAGVSCTPPLK